MILLLGEAGVGKELFARYIHTKSAYANAPFVSINCACDNLDKIKSASGGTLFFDEIAVLPFVIQEELLSLLNKRNTAHSSVSGYRIIASTKNDLERKAEEGNFIRELYYKLNVLPLYIPPLRQRTEDIPSLAGYFLKKYMLETKKHFNGFTNNAFSFMKSAHWRGNVRELKNCIERACFTSQGDVIDEQDLLIRYDFWYTGDRSESKWDLKAAIDSFKRIFVIEALENNRWNQTLTARALGIQRTYLSKLIKDMQINRGSE